MARCEGPPEAHDNAADNATSLSFMTAITLEEYHEEQWTPTHNDDASIVDTAAMLALSYPPTAPPAGGGQTEEEVYYPQSHRGFELMITEVVKHVKQVLAAVRDAMIPEEVQPVANAIVAVITESSSAVVLLLVCCSCCVCLVRACQPPRRAGRLAKSRQPPMRHSCSARKPGRNSNGDDRSRKGKCQTKSRADSGPKFEALGMGLGAATMPDYSDEDEEEQAGVTASSADAGRTIVMLPSSWEKSTTRPSKAEMARCVASNKFSRT